MGMKFTNNASTTLASGILVGATALTVQTGAGALFPALGAGDYFYCTLSNTSGSIEIIKVTARTGDTFSTIVRAQDGTSALAWNAGDRVELRLVSASLNDFPKLDENNVFTGTNTENLSTSSTAVTQTIGDNSTKISTTAFVQGTVTASGFSSVTATVATNALTCTLVAPASLQFRNTTLTSGAPLSSLISSNLSITVPSGATLGTVNATQARLILLVAYNGGSPVLCITNLSGGLDLDETTLISPTTISAGATAANVIYSASAVGANSPFRVVGFCDITEATAGTWATGPTLVQGIGGQALAMSGLGYGQTWQNLTGSRVPGTTYYNTTGKPIFVAVGINSTAAAATIIANVNSIIIYGTSVGVSGYTSAVSVIVPPGNPYSVNISSGTPSVNGWAELR